MNLWLVRHAQPLVDDGICYGATDLAADSVGTVRSAEALSRILPQSLPVKCSPLVRCVHLAESLVALRPDLGLDVDARLAEMNFGSWENVAWENITKDEIDAWTKDFARHRCGDGECVEDLMERVSAALLDARRAHTDTVWITHAGVIRAVLLIFRGTRPRSAREWPRDDVPFGSWHTVPLL